jgi:hypothetical protein
MDYQPSNSSVVLTVNKASLTVTSANASRLYGTANPTFTGTVTGAVNGDTFTETFATSATASSASGTYAIVPTPVGANLANYAPVLTNGTLTITPAATTTTLALSSQSLTMTATVASSTTGTPTGTVSFYASSSSSALGSAPVVNGVATYTAPSFPAGGFTLSAQYSGDTNFSASTSTGVPVLALVSGTSTLTVGKASSGTDNFTLTTPNGYSGTVQFSCSGLPQYATCTFQPATLTFGGTTTSGSTMMTITTGVRADLLWPHIPQREEREIGWAGLFGLPGLLAIACGRRRRLLRSMRLLVLLSLMLAGASLVGCGGSGGSGGSVSSPTGTYTVQVTATAPSGVSQSTSIALTVQ